MSENAVRKDRIIFSKGYGNRDYAVLKFLAICQENKVPVQMKTLKWFFRACTERNIRNSLAKLVQYNRIEKFGEPHHYLYVVTRQGQEYLIKRLTKELENELSNNLKTTLRNALIDENNLEKIKEEVV